MVARATGFPLSSYCKGWLQKHKGTVNTAENGGCRVWGLTACKPSEVYACQEKKLKHCTPIAKEKWSQYLEDICLYLLKHKSHGPGTCASKSDSICMFFLTHKSSCMQNGMNNAGTELPEWIIFHEKPGTDGLPSRNVLGTVETNARKRISNVCASAFLSLNVPLLIHMKAVLWQWYVPSLNALNNNNKS